MNLKHKVLTGHPTGYSRCQALASRALNTSCYFGQSARSIESRCVVMIKCMGWTNVSSALFTKDSHHKSLRVIYIMQNLFDQHREHRTISLNAHYLVNFKNPRGVSQIVNLGKQRCLSNFRTIEKNRNPNLAASRLHEIFRWDVRPCSNCRKHFGKKMTVL